jgi:hypothetical protein
MSFLRSAISDASRGVQVEYNVAASGKRLPPEDLTLLRQLYQSDFALSPFISPRRMAQGGHRSSREDQFAGALDAVEQFDDLDRGRTK